MEKSSITRGLAWKLLERFGVHGIQFVLQIILARLLDPAHYGALSLMIIFATLANVFIQNGFNTALIQNKDTSDEDFSSVFWITLLIAVGLYGGLYFAAPLIAQFYEMPEIVSPFRVLTLILLPGAFNSIQLAKVSREMNFRKVFFGNISGIIVSGTAGVVIAFLGGGLWALVAQSLLGSVVPCMVMWFTVRFRPKLVCNLVRVKVLFRFGWKLLVSSLIDTLYQDLRSLVIGKKYDAGTLGYYNRGKQFPQLIINSVNSSVVSVMLPAMSQKQSDPAALKSMMRRSISISAYVIFPMMAGLAGVSVPLVTLLLTEKWLPCVPYLIIYCVTLAFYPVHSCNLQAINAMGRSDLFLKLELIKKSYGIVALVIAVFCFESPIAIALTGIITTVISCFVNAYPNRKLVGYSYRQQMADILPTLLLSAAMGVAVWSVLLLGLSNLVTLLIQIPLGILIYLFGSWLFKMESFTYLLTMIKGYLKRKNSKKQNDA